MTTEALFEHVAAPHRLISKGELALRQDDVPRVSREPDHAASWLQQWVSTLELTLVLTSLQEACVQLGLTTLAEALRSRDRVDDLVRLLSRLDLDRVVAENGSLLAPYARFQAPAEAPMAGDPEQLARAVQSLLLNCPIEEVERVGARLQKPDASHRCRLAHEALRAFVARTTHPASDSLRAAGQAYAEGRLELPEVATVWGLSVPDAVALLEQQGYRRDLDGLRLPPDARRARLKAIREDRERRNGEPSPDDGAVDRDVIASQRIEGIDARPWLRP